MTDTRRLSDIGECDPMYHVSRETTVEYRDEPHARVSFIKVLSKNIP